MKSSKKKQQDLKPCPLCGNTTVMCGDKYSDLFNVSCGLDSPEDYGCGLVLFADPRSTRHEMIEKWNTRA